MRDVNERLQKYDASKTRLLVMFCCNGYTLNVLWLREIFSPEIT